MKATELQLNDLVLDQHGKVTRVTSMSEKIIVTELDGGMTLSLPEQLQPIELTEEILVKNGFDFTKRNYGVCCKEDKYGDVELSKDKNGFYWSINTDEYEILRVDYVHQLQHLLRLCGIEKEIEL